MSRASATAVPYSYRADMPIDDKSLIFEPFQRFADGQMTAFARALAHIWRIEAVCAIVLANLGNGQWSVIDGGQRIRAARLLGLKTLPAFIHDDLSYAGRARLFTLLDHKLKLSPFDIFNALVEAQDERAVDVRDTLNRHHLHLKPGDYGKGHPDVFRAIGAAMEIARDKGVVALDAAIRIFRSWDSEQQIQGYPLRGLSAVVVGKDEFDLVRFADRLASYTYADLDAVVRQIANGNGAGDGRLWKNVFRKVDREELELERVLREEASRSVTTRTQVAA